MFLLVLALQHAGAQRLTGGRAGRFAPPSGQSGASRRFRMLILVLKNLILIGHQNHCRTNPQQLICSIFGSTMWRSTLWHATRIDFDFGPFFRLASLPQSILTFFLIWDTTLIDFGPICIRVTALIDFDTLFGLGSLP